MNKIYSYKFILTNLTTQPVSFQTAEMEREATLIKSTLIKTKTTKIYFNKPDAPASSRQCLFLYKLPKKKWVFGRREPVEYLITCSNSIYNIVRKKDYEKIPKAADGSGN